MRPSGVSESSVFYVKYLEVQTEVEVKLVGSICISSVWNVYFIYFIKDVTV